MNAILKFLMKDKEVSPPHSMYFDASNYILLSDGEKIYAKLHLISIYYNNSRAFLQFRHIFNSISLFLFSKFFRVLPQLS